MADISKIKLNNNGTIATYNIKDEKSRTGFATASWVTYTENLLEKHKMAWYEDNAKTTELGSVSLDDRTLSNLTVLSSLNIPDQITFTGNGVTGTSTKLFVRVNSASNKPEYVLLSTTTGTSSGNSTEVTIPMGANGTVALLSDIEATSAEINDLIDQLDDILPTKVGWGFKTNNNTESNGLNGHTTLHFREESTSNTDLFSIPLDNVQFESITGCSSAIITDLSTGSLSVGHSIIELGNEYTSLSHGISIGGNQSRRFLFESGTTSDNKKTVSLDMDRNGTIALQEELFGGVYYNNRSIPTQIEFYSREDWDSTESAPVANSTPIATLDATAFVKDAMVSSVEISNGNLVITWNSDAALLPTSIPLTNIFNPANYYTKTDADGRYVTSVNWNTTGTEGKITYTKNGSSTDVVEVLNTVSSGNKKPISSGAVHTALLKKADLDFGNRLVALQAAPTILDDINKRWPFIPTSEDDGKVYHCSDGKIRDFFTGSDVDELGSPVTSEEVVYATNTPNYSLLYFNRANSKFYKWNGSSMEEVATSSIEETDPVFLASAAYGISSQDITNWNNSLSYPNLNNKPILKTDNTAAQQTSASETITGTINLHKISKTGTLADAIDDSTHRLVTDTEKSIWNKKVIYGKLTSGSFYKGTRGSGGTWTYSSTAETAAVDLIYVDVNANPPKAYCWDGSYKELSITVASEITENGTNPVQSSTIYTALQGLTNAFNTAIDDVIEDVTYTSATRLLSKKKVGDSTATGLVILPTATVTSETLEIVLASVPS